MRTELEKKEMLRLSNEETNRITRECLQKALIRSMGSQDLEKLSITEIVRIAGVSRSAFYRNYATKEALLEETISNVKNMIAAAIVKWQCAKSNDEKQKWLASSFKSVQDNAGELLCLIKIRKSLFEPDDIEALIPQGSEEQRYVYTARFASILGIMTRWLTSGMKESPEEMSRICCNIFQI